LQAQTASLRTPASKREVWINILASVALLAIGWLLWELGSKKPDGSHNGFYVALGWAFVLYGIGLFVDRKYKFSNPIIIAKRVIIYILLAIIGLLIRLTTTVALVVVVGLLFVGMNKVASWWWPHEDVTQSGLIQEDVIQSRLTQVAKSLAPQTELGKTLDLERRS
jgi:hypothetical protein